MRTRPFPPIAATLLLAAAAAPAYGQTVGFEAGLASVEGFEESVSPAFGVSLFAPLTDRLMGSLTYSQWTGDPEERAGATAGTFAGNRGVNAMALARLFGERGATGWLGAGLGVFEQEEVGPDGGETRWEEAFTLGAMATRPLSSFVSIYGRGDVSFPFSGSSASWGLFRLGVAARLY